MHKTISITLAGLVFYVEEPAYQKLDSYLTAVKQHFTTQPGKEEIIADIESRFAEQFSTKINANKNVINLAEVEEVIKNMGTVDEMDGFNRTSDKAESASAEEDARLVKRLYRNPDDQILGGVASGLAAYFGIDPVIVRILFVLLTFAWGTSIVIYILLWLIMPEAKTPSQKYEMRGQPMTLKEIEETVKKAFPEKTAESVRTGAGRAASFAGGFVRKFFVVIGKIIKVIFLIVAGIIGVALVIAGVAAAIGLTILFATLLVNPAAPYIDFPLAEFASGTAEYYVLLITGFAAAMIPLIFLVAGGNSVLKRKKTLRTGVTVALIAVWVVAIGLGSAFFGRVWPEYKRHYDELLAQQESNEKVFEVGDFDKISLGGGHDVTITYGETASVKAFGSEKTLEGLAFEIRDTTLQKTGGNDYWDGRICIFCFYKPARIEIITPEFTGGNFSGAVKVEAQDFVTDEIILKLSGASNFTGRFTSSSTVANLSGASRLNLNLESSQSLDIKSSGASRTDISGSGNNLSVELSGASRLEAENFTVNSVGIRASGSSRATVNTSDSLEVRASGASSIIYFGDPTETEFNLSGSSKTEMR